MQKCDPKVIIIFFVKNLLSTIYILPIWWIGVGIFAKVWNPPSIIPKEPVLLLLNSAGIIYLLLLLVGSYYWAWLTYANYAYSLENDGLHIYKGVILKKHSIIPYHYMQNFQIYANPFVVRLLGLYYLHIRTREIENTAGILHHAYQEQLPGMSAEEVNNLRTKLIASSHTMSIQPRKYFDPTSGKYR